MIRVVLALVLGLFIGTAAFAAAPSAVQVGALQSNAAPTVEDGAGRSRIQSPEIGSTIAAKLAADDAASSAGPISGEDGRLSSAVEIALLLTVLSLLPAILISLTSFTRIVIVLSFIRRALSLNELPPNPVIIGLALFLTMFVMAPVGNALYGEAWQPYDNGEIELEEATGRAWGTMSTFLVSNTREAELRLFADLAKAENVFAYIETNPTGVVFAGEGSESAVGRASGSTEVAPAVLAKDLPLTVVVPAFILSELKTAFQMGFLLFLPFLVIDLVVASILLSMGMFMLPPAMISTPIKVLIFVLVDGWRLVTESVVTSFVQTGVL